MSTNNPLAQLRIVRIADPSIDLAAMDLAGYLRSREFDLLKFKDDSKPDVFIITKLPMQHLTALKDLTSGKNNQAINAVAMACHRIEMGNGEVMVPEKINQIRLGATTIAVADDAWAVTLSETFGYNALIEIGTVAIEFAGLPKNAHGPFSY